MDPRSQIEKDIEASANPKTEAEWVRAVNTPGSIIQQEITNAVIQAAIEKKAVEAHTINLTVIARLEKMITEFGIRRMETRVRNWLQEERRLSHSATSPQNVAMLQTHQALATRNLAEVQTHLRYLMQEQKAFEKAIKSHETKIHSLDNQLKTRVKEWDADVGQQAKAFTDKIHAGKVFLKNEHGQALPMTAERLNHMAEAYKNAPSPVRMFMKNPELINRLIELTANSTTDETAHLVKTMFGNMGGVLGQLQLVMAVRQLVSNDENVSAKQVLALIKENRDLKMEPFSDKQMNSVVSTFLDLKEKLDNQNALQPLKDSLAQNKGEIHVAQEFIKVLQERLQESPDNNPTPKP